MRAHDVGEMSWRVLECEPPCVASDLKCLLDFAGGVPRDLYLFDHQKRLVSPSDEYHDCGWNNSVTFRGRRQSTSRQSRTFERRANLHYVRIRIADIGMRNYMVSNTLGRVSDTSQRTSRRFYGVKNVKPFAHPRALSVNWQGT
jgi:hypothetical protein